MTIVTNNKESDEFDSTDSEYIPLPSESSEEEESEDSESSEEEESEDIENEMISIVMALNKMVKEHENRTPRIEEKREMNMIMDILNEYKSNDELLQNISRIVNTLEKYPKIDNYLNTLLDEYIFSLNQEPNNNNKENILKSVEEEEKSNYNRNTIVTRSQLKKRKNDNGNNSNNEINVLTPRKKLTFSDKINYKSIDQFKSTIKRFNNLNDLIIYAKEWKLFKGGVHCNELTFNEIENDRILNILEEMESINNLIGMDEIKNTLCKQILYYVQHLHGNEMKNVVITGSPGTGKTTVARLLSLIYSRLGILSKGTFIVASRSDLIAGYVGQTALKTRKVLDEALGGVLFIDEAYSLSDKSEDGDSFSKECMNEINQYISEHRDIVVIIAGYKDMIDRNFFSANPGLERRFPWRFHINDYTIDELSSIFKYRVEIDRWEFNDVSMYEIGLGLKRIGLSNFNNFGGDCEKLFNVCKIKHSERIFLLSDREKRNIRAKINKDDYKNGVDEYIKLRMKYNCTNSNLYNLYI